MRDEDIIPVLTVDNDDLDELLDYLEEQDLELYLHDANENLVVIFSDVKDYFKVATLGKHYMNQNNIEGYWIHEKGKIIFDSDINVIAVGKLEKKYLDLNTSGNLYILHNKKVEIRDMCGDHLEFLFDYHNCEVLIVSHLEQEEAQDILRTYIDKKGNPFMELKETNVFGKTLVKSNITKIN